MKEAVADGVRRLIDADRGAKQFTISPTGKMVGTAISVAGASGIRQDSRITTGYDPVKGVTTVAFVMGVSPVGGDDVWSM